MGLDENGILWDKNFTNMLNLFVQNYDVDDKYKRDI